WQMKLHVILDEVAPIRNFPMRKNVSPFLTQEIRSLMCDRDKMACRYRNNNSDSRLCEELKILKRKVKSKIRYEMQRKGSMAFSSPDRGDAWKFIKEASFTSKGSDEPPLAIQ